jgi:ergothioneine biosynthesis protein EgtB
VRAATERLAAPLSPEDQLLQSMPSCSPTKWHRAHTTWFFETFLLAPRGVKAFDDRFGPLFNSYYDAFGWRHARPKRGLLSRPTVDEIAAYRRAVDERTIDVLTTAPDDELARITPIVELGLAHEEQHQELLLTDILHAFSENPLLPAYRARREPRPAGGASGALRFCEIDGGLHTIGAPDDGAFSFDNERPRHKVWVEPFALADRLVTVGEMRAFIDARGYTTPSLWLAEGYERFAAGQTRAPMHATYEDGVYRVFTLDGLRDAQDDEPVAHVSFYEADAIARFLGARLPTEVEWEVAASSASSRAQEGNFVEDAVLHPIAAPAVVSAPRSSSLAIRQLFGDVWEWTRSGYEPYPGFAPEAGAVGEYNGKFMVGQYVLRGGSCFSPRRHLRATYRNFWHPDTRFQMTGIRLARAVPR